MLQYLQIKNLALMTEASLDWEAGFNVVTGETGAGKSVLLGALGLLAGNRADKTLIRQGADACEVEAVLYFEEASLIDAVLQELNLPRCEEGQLVLRRLFHAKRAAKIHVNGALATLSNLQAIGEVWIDFHGPGEPQKLFKERYQLEMLDLYAENESLLEAYAKDYTAWRALLKKADDLARADRLSEDEISFIQSQVAAIDELELSEERLADLERDYSRLDKARELGDLASGLEMGLQGDEGILTQMMPLVKLAHELSDLDTNAQPLGARLDSVVLEIEDLAAEFSSLLSDFDFDEETAQHIQESMSAWLEIKRKYGPDLSLVMEKRDALADKVAMQSDIEGTLRKLEEEAAALEVKLREQANVLRERRMRAAKQLAKGARAALSRLGFKKAGLSLEVIPETELREYGNSRCSFLFSPNAGQEALPLNKIASSGETARVMLALKTVLAEVDSTPVLVFDEVDANVGGEIGGEVGKELAALAPKGHQVFCVTHLPQVAAQGEFHYVVEKIQSAKTTSVSIKPIHGEDTTARKVELARMLGDRQSAAALSHAEELLSIHL